MAKKNKKSKYTELDKIKLIGILRKTKVEYYDDLYIDTRSNYNIDDLLYALIDIMEKAIRNCENEKYCLNVATALNITTYELLDVNINLNSDYMDKLSNLKKLYVHNCEANKNMPNDELLEIFAKIDHNIISNGIILAGESVDSNLEIESEVVEEEEVSLSIEDVLKQFHELENKYDKQSCELEEYRKKDISNEKKLNKKEQFIQSQQEDIKKLREQVKELKNTSIKQEKQVSKLSQDKEQLLEDNQELVKNNHIITRELTQNRGILQQLQKRVTVIDQKEQEDLKEQEIIDQIFQIITEKEVTIEEIYYRLEKKISPKRIKKALQQLKMQINLSYDEIKGCSPVYKVSKPIIEINKVINVKPYRNTLDILVVSDFHIGQFSEYDKKVINRIYEYAYDNGIKMILNLGDFFSYDYLSGTDTINKISYNEKVLEQVIENMPYDSSIHHYLLGGNHDKRLLNYGIDPLKVLESRRSDIHSLGYDDAIISFKNDAIALHHMNKRLPENLNHEFDSEEFKKVFNEYIISNGLNHGNVLFDLFGHFHKSYINIEDNYAFVPSLFNDRIQNGALHLKFYFDNSGIIESINIIPLIRDANVHRADSKVLEKRFR